MKCSGPHERTGDAFRDVARMKTRVISTLLALGVKKGVIRYTRHTAELVFLDTGNYPDVEVKDRKELGQDAWEKRGEVPFTEIEMGGADLRALTLGTCHTVACLYKQPKIAG